MPKISVIVPCYNVSRYLVKGLESLLNQTLKDIEIICIDDKSSDGTLDILESYSKKDTRIKLIKHSENQGVAVARNNGIKAAQGDYIGFIDPDDYVDIDFYEKLYKKAISSKADVVKGNVIIYFSNGHKKNATDDIKAIEGHVYNFSNKFWSAIYNTKFIKQNGIDFPKDVRTGQDSVFLSKVVLYKPKISTVKNSFYHYIYQRPGSLGSEILSHDKVLSRITTLNYKLKFLKETENCDNIERRIFLYRHILDNFVYTFSKRFEDSGDKERLFNWLVNSKIPDAMLLEYFGQERGQAVLDNKYNGFCTYSKKILFYTKEILPNGKRNIYLGKLKIFSYKKN